MPYATQEESEDSGNPIEFLKAAIGLDRQFLYTSSRSDLTVGLDVYKSIYLDRDQPSMAPQIQDNKITIRLPRDCDLALLFLTSAPSETVWIAYYRKHEDDSEIISYFQGRIAGIEWQEDTAIFTVTTLESMLKRMGLRVLCGPTCRFFLADGDCPVPESAITINATPSSVSGTTIVSSDFASKPDNWFQFGSIRSPLGEERFVLSHIGNTIELMFPFEVSPSGMLCTIMAGCDYLPQTCHDKFGTWTDDGADHGAFNLIPIPNVFSSGLG